MEEKIIKEKRMENGLTLAVHDRSRKIAGDRWLVKITAEIKIPVKDVMAGQDAPSNPGVEKITELLGDEVAYEYQDERNFVDDSEKEAVLNEMLDSYMNSSFAYLSNPEFPRRVILREYGRALEKRSWYASDDA